MPSDRWACPRLWPGAECFILGGGPSLAQVDLSRLAGRRVIAVNNAYKLGAWDVLWFGDCRWYDWHQAALKDWPGGIIVTACEALKGRYRVFTLKRRNHPYGIYTDPHLIAWNLSSGASAINLAVHLGVRRIVLLGYDMRKVDGRNNWHPDHPIDQQTRDPYRRFLIPFPFIKTDLDRLGVELVNATPGSGLTLFPVVDPEEVLPAREEIVGVA